MLWDNMLRAAVHAMKPLPNIDGAALKIGFWVMVGVYVLCPLLFAILDTSSLSYRAVDHERFVPGLNEALKIEHHCRFDDCDDVPVVWRDRQTGTVYRQEYFRDYRRGEIRRLGSAWFIYGALGCLLAAWYRQHFFGERVAANLALYLIGNAVLVGTLLLNLPT